MGPSEESSREQSKEELPENSFLSLKNVSKPIPYLLCLGLGYYLGNNLSILDIRAGSWSLLAKPNERIDRQIDFYLKHPEEKKLVINHIIDKVREQNAEDPLGKGLISLAETSSKPFSWGYQWNIDLVPDSKVVEEQFVACSDSQLIGKELSLVVYDKHGSSVEGARGTVVGPPRGVRNSCSANRLRVGDERILDALTSNPGSVVKARKLITIPLAIVNE